MRKGEREITEKNELIEILKNGKFVSIAMCRDNEPYVVTLSYGYDVTKQVMYFHAAIKGLKLDFIRANPNVCATVIEDKGYVVDQCEQKYRSVVLWGKMFVVEEIDEQKYGINVLLNHLEKDPVPIYKRNIPDDTKFKKVSILRMDIKEMTGKATD
jgi:nitroimidazol reductase NimA-like FMN-containing flavoprotein (pyridoxamine 5'-phosphate oxidase superfamily)